MKKNINNNPYDYKRQTIQVDRIDDYYEYVLN